LPPLACPAMVLPPPGRVPFPVAAAPSGAPASVSSRAVADAGAPWYVSGGRALDRWRRKMRSGPRLGSPAPATGAAVAGGWPDRVLSGAMARGYRIDLTSPHWYGSDYGAGAVSRPTSYPQATPSRYHEPIRLTPTLRCGR
jgi:hypothetical protein